MNDFFCTIHPDGFLTLIIRKSGHIADGVFYHPHPPAFFLWMKKQIQKSTVESTMFKDEENRIMALKKVSTYHDLIILSDIAGQILISDDVQIVSSDILIFRTRDELMEKLMEMSTDVSIQVIQNLFRYLGQERITTLLTHCFKQDEDPPSINEEQKIEQ